MTAPDISDAGLSSLLIRARDVAANVGAAGHADAAGMIGRLANAVAALKGENDGQAAVIRVLKHRLKQEEEA